MKDKHTLGGVKDSVFSSISTGAELISRVFSIGDAIAAQAEVYATNEVTKAKVNSAMDLAQEYEALNEQGFDADMVKSNVENMRRIANMF